MSGELEITIGRQLCRYFTHRRMIVHKTGYIPRCSLCSHSLVHSKNNSWFLGIQPLLDQDLIKLFLWWYLFSTFYFSMDKVLLYIYVIYTRYEIINYFIFVSMKIYFWLNYISQSFQFCICTTKVFLSYFGFCFTNRCCERGKSIDTIVSDYTYY